MSPSPLAKSLVLFAVILAIVGTSFTYVVYHYKDRENRIAFKLTNHEGNHVTEQDLSGKSLLVFFGFTNCRDICPTQMSKLSNVMTTLDGTGHGQLVTPVFISVDPERDNADNVANYLEYFHERFVGLTGSRVALRSTADRFKTFLDQVPQNTTPGYQLTHSSIVYVVDPYSQIIDFVPFTEPVDKMVQRILKHI